MDGPKNETNDSSAATYKPIPEKDMEEEAANRTKKAVVKVKSNGETDGADEKMLPNDDKKAVINASEKLPPGDKQNGDAKLDIGEPKSSYGGMDKEELMKYANDPFWVRLRWFLFIGFWALWAAMLIGAVLIIYAAPKCNPPPPRTWWQEGPLAELSPETKPDSVKTLDSRIRGVIIPVSGDAYIDSDKTNEIKSLITTAKEKGINVIVDLNPATSTKWFVDEKINESFAGYYIWKPAKETGNGGAPLPPNNWINKNNQPSWKYSESRRQFYYNPLGEPHLNFRNSSVIEEFSNVIRKFLGFGAAGVRIRNAAMLLVDEKFMDEKLPSQKAGFDHTQYNFYIHTKTENLEDLGLLLLKWRGVVRNVTGDGPFIVAEELSKVQSYVVNNSLVVDLPLKAHVFDRANVSDIVNNLHHTFHIDNMEWPLWRVNSSAFPADVLGIVTYLLPGTTFVDTDIEINAQLQKIRQSPSIMRGLCNIHSLNNNTVLSYIRVTPGNPGFLVALNAKEEKVVVNFPANIPLLSSLQEVTIQLFSKNYNETEFMTLNSKKPADAVPISPKSVLIMSYVPKKDD